MDALVLYCCIRNHSPVYNKYLLFHIVSESQESRNWEELNWMVHELAVKICEGFTGLEEELSNLLMLAGGFSLLLHGPLLKAPHNMAAGFPPKELPDKQNA